MERKSLKVKPLSLEESKALMVSMLQVFDSFCEEHKLRYSLSEGTLLGAIRHKGFIPWDDDLDVVMPRVDYELFLELWADTERYKLIRNEKGSTWSYPYARISDNSTSVQEEESAASFYSGGLWIDINPLDCCPSPMENDTHFKEYVKHITRSYKLYRAKTRRKWLKNATILHNLMWVAIKALLIPIPSESLRRKMDRALRKFNGKATNWVGWYFAPTEEFIAFPDFFNQYLKVEFEGHLFSAVSSYDDFLRLEYGDYMQFPPVEQRVPSHKFNAFRYE